MEEQEKQTQTGQQAQAEQTGQQAQTEQTGQQAQTEQAGQQAQPEQTGQQAQTEQTGQQAKPEGRPFHPSIWMAGVIVLVLIALVCGGIAISKAYRQEKAQEQMEELKTQAIVEPPQPESTQPPQPQDPIQVLTDAGVPIPEKEVDFAALQEETNPDIYAWIYIPDTMIDYPVLQHPEDNTYYLNYNLDGSKGYPGCIYTENYNTKDFSDPNTVIYGHNMKNGSMFAGLHKFEDGGYFEEHPYVYVYTPEQLYVYEIFAAHQYSNAHILLSYDFTDEAVYREFLEDIKSYQGAADHYREGVEVTTEDRILTLSTCIANQGNKRYLVQAVLLNGKDPSQF